MDAEQTAAREELWQRRMRLPVLTAALLAVVAVFLHVSAVSATAHDVGVVLSWLVWAAFSAEVAVMMCVAADRRAWLAANKLTVVIVAVSFPLVAVLAQGLLAARAGGSLWLVGSLKLSKLLTLAKLGALHRTWTVWRSRSRLGGLRMGLLLAVSAVTAVGVITAAFSERRYRTPAHATWAVVDGVWVAVAVAALCAAGVYVIRRRRCGPPDVPAHAHDLRPPDGQRV